MRHICYINLNKKKKTHIIEEDKEDAKLCWNASLNFSYNSQIYDEQDKFLPEEFRMYNPQILGGFDLFFFIDWLPLKDYIKRNEVHYF